MIKAIFDNRRIFDYPKSVGFVADILRFGDLGPNDIVIDSFAGSGTTAHAVLALNNEDGGNRRFILVECEDYADTITAERVRRVIKGVPTAKNKQLREGLGGSFAYCELGEPIEIDRLLSGQSLPSFSDLARYLLHTAKGFSTESSNLAPQDEDGRFYTRDSTDFYLLYQPDLDYLRSNAAVLNEERALRIQQRNQTQGREAIVFAAAKYISQQQLAQMGITFCQLPDKLLAGE